VLAGRTCGRAATYGPRAAGRGAVQFTGYAPGGEEPGMKLDATPALSRANLIRWISRRPADASLRDWTTYGAAKDKVAS
jgi:hypothetical protein